MAKQTKKSQKVQTKVHDLVVVTYADDIEQAREFEILLKNDDIPAMIKEDEQTEIGSQGIAILVPEEYIDEAHVVIESQDAYDDFYDMALEDDDMDDFDNSFLDDGF
jgi:hypothetical protein